MKYWLDEDGDILITDNKLTRFAWYTINGEKVDNPMWDEWYKSACIPYVDRNIAVSNKYKALSKRELFLLVL